MSKEFTEVEAFLRLQFLSRIKNDLEHPRADAIHVSSLVYGCPRRVYFDWKFTNFQGVYSSYDEQSLANFWIGTKIHELPITNVMITKNGVKRIDFDNVEIREEFFSVGNWKLRRMIANDGKEYGVLGFEVPVWDEEYNVTGSIDELVMLPDGKLIIVDKKSATSIPNKPYDHHIKQIKMYAYLLEKNYGVRVDGGAIFYIKKVGDKSWELLFRPYEVNMRDYRKVANEMLGVARKVLDADVKNVVPEAKVSWLCSKCPYYQLCIDIGYGEKKFDIIQRKESVNDILSWIVPKVK